MGIEKPSAVFPIKTKINKISSEAYATDERASEEKTDNALVLFNRSWLAKDE